MLYLSPATVSFTGRCGEFLLVASGYTFSPATVSLKEVSVIAPTSAQRRCVGTLPTKAEVQVRRFVYCLSDFLKVRKSTTSYPRRCEGALPTKAGAESGSLITVLVTLNGAKKHCLTPTKVYNDTAHEGVIGSPAA